MLGKKTCLSAIIVLMCSENAFSFEVDQQKYPPSGVYSYWLKSVIDEKKYDSIAKIMELNAKFKNHGSDLNINYDITDPCYEGFIVSDENGISSYYRLYLDNKNMSFGYFKESEYSCQYLSDDKVEICFGKDSDGADNKYFAHYPEETFTKFVSAQDDNDIRNHISGTSKLDVMEVLDCRPALDNMIKYIKNEKFGKTEDYNGFGTIIRLFIENPSAKETMQRVLQ